MQQQKQKDNDKRIKLLVTFVANHVGGAMTSLVNFVNTLDKTKYEVDVLFYERKGEGRFGINEDVNILPSAKEQGNRGAYILRRLLSPSFMLSKVRYIYFKHVRKDKIGGVQHVSKQGARLSMPLQKEYDIAICYEYAWPMYYLFSKVKAKKKVLWHHMDYVNSGFNYRVDKKCFDMADAMVFVSESTKSRFISKYPKYKDKCYFMPNILTSDYVRAKGDKEREREFDISSKGLRLLSVARVDFLHKAFDRAFRVFGKLKKDGLLENVTWTILGKRYDGGVLDGMMDELDLSKHIIFGGIVDNPMPYMKNSDALLLLSNTEGKPMVVTEAQIMGLVPVVTNFSSAHEQIQNGVDGIIFQNDEKEIYKGLKELLSDTSPLVNIKQNILSKDYGNQRDIEKFDLLCKTLLKDKKPI